MLINYRNGDNFGVAVASPPRRKKSFAKTAHIRLRVDVSEKFAIDHNLTTHISIRYAHKYIAQWEISTKRKHKRAKDHLHDTHSLNTDKRSG